MTLAPLDAASLVLVAIPVLGLTGAALFALLRRGRTGGVAPRTVFARAGSYAALALVLLAAARTGTPGMALLLGALGAVALVEWARLFDLPGHHRVALVVAHVVVVTVVALEGPGAADWLVGGVVLVGAAWPVVRADTGRAIRDLGYAAVGAVMITVLLAHGVALVAVHGAAGSALFVALAAACATSDIGAFMVGRTFGRHPLAPRLSPNKTAEGVVGNLLGAAAGLALFTPAILPPFGLPVLLALVPVVAAGSVWGDLLESAAKREAQVKDAGTWLPGFGGILDRIDSLLITVPLAYWLVVLAGRAG